MKEGFRKALIKWSDGRLRSDDLDKMVDMFDINMIPPHKGINWYANEIVSRIDWDKYEGRD